MAGYVRDLWHTVNRATGRKVRTDRYGKGKRWKVRRVVDGREHTKAFDTKDAAVAWLARQEADVTGVDPRAGAIPFKQYAEDWREKRLSHSDSTRTAVEKRLRLHVYPAIGHRHLNAVRRSDIEHLVVLMSKDLAPSTLRVGYSYVASIFTAAVLDRLIVASPCVGIDLPTVSRKRVTPLTVEQVRAIEAALPEPLRAAMVLASASGLRPSEWRELTIDRLSPSLHVRGRVMPTQCTVRVEDSKTEASARSVVIGETATRALVEHLARYGPGEDGLIFHNPDGSAFTASQTDKAWDAATEGMRLGARSGFHMARHFHASLLIAAGKSPRAVADRLGHANPTITLAIYSHLWETDEQDMIDATEAALGGVF